MEEWEWLFRICCCAFPRQTTTNGETQELYTFYAEGWALALIAIAYVRTFVIRIFVPPFVVGKSIKTTEARLFYI